MNKQEFLSAIAQQAGKSVSEVSSVLDAMEEVIIITIPKEKIQLSGYGSYELRKKAAREGRNPATGETIKIAASNDPVFKFGKSFKENFNKPKK